MRVFADVKSCFDQNSWIKLLACAHSQQAHGKSEATSSIEGNENCQRDIDQKSSICDHKTQSD